MKLSFSRVHCLFLTGTVAVAIAHPVVAQDCFVPRTDIIPAHPLVAQDCFVPRNDTIEKAQNVVAQKQDNPPKDESAGGSR